MTNNGDKIIYVVSRPFDKSVNFHGVTYDGGGNFANMNNYSWKADDGNGSIMD